MKVQIVCFSNHALVKEFFLRLWHAFKWSVLEAPKRVSTKALLLKHAYRRQGCSKQKTDFFLKRSSRCFSTVFFSGDGFSLKWSVAAREISAF